MPAPYLNTIHYILDEVHSIENLSFIKNDPAQLEKYSTAGMKNHYKTNKSLSEMAEEVLALFLKENSSVKDSIDTILFTTDNLDRSNDINVVSINRILKKLEMPNAFPVIQGASKCANIGSCLGTAAALVESGRAENVLVVSVDKMSGNDESYQMDPEMAVLSDAAVCLWIASVPSQEAFSIGKIFQRNNPDQWLIDRKLNYQQYSINKLKLFTYIGKNIKTTTEGKVDSFVLNNYFKHILDMFIGILGIKPDLIDFSNLPKLGHAPAGDIFINLADLLENKKIAPNATIALVADSPSLCIGIILKKEN